MKQIPSFGSVSPAGRAALNWAGVFALSVAPFAFIGCNSAESEVNGRADQAVEISLADSCGYRVTGQYLAPWANDGYQGRIELTNVSGVTATAFEIFADLGGAAIEMCPHAEFVAVEGGYSLTAPHWLDSSLLSQGQMHRMQFKSSSEHSSITPYIISINGVLCDQVVPVVSLNASGSFYAAGGTLTLTATANDNVAVKKVVFTRDGQVIATDTSAPYTLEVPITDSLNGRHRYVATAYDPTGNATNSNTKSVLTSIGNKFFGTAVDNAADYSALLTYFDQLTPANAGKWGSVEATRNVMNWANLDTAYDFAKQNGIPFKLHTLIWGQQQPTWLASLTPQEQLAELDEWMSLVAQRYPDIDLIDVVNEPMHAVPAYSAALGGAGATGWDWVIKSFELARSHFPNSELILNDYNVLILQSFTNDYLQIINVLQQRGLIDGIGLQGNFLERAELPVVAANLDTLAANGLPIYISELDVAFAKDARQDMRVSELFPIFWQHPAVVGVTHWGYLEGAMWRPDAYLVRTDGSTRPAMDWLNCYRAGGTNCSVPTYVPTPRSGDKSSILLEAEDYDDAVGVMALGNVVAYTDNGDWQRFDRVVFDGNWDSLSVTYAKGNQDVGNVSIHLGSLSNPPIATIELPSTGGWGTNKTVTVPWAPISGERNVFIRYNGGYGIANLDSVKFAAPAGLSANVVANSDFETSASGWYTWGTGTLATTSGRALSGAQSLLLSGRTGNSPIATTLTASVVPGKTYKVSVGVSVGGADSAKVHVTQKIQCQDASASYSWLGSEVTVNNGAWAVITGDLVVPDCALKDVTIYAEGPDAGVDLYIDHVSARAPAAANLVGNGSFESGTAGWSTWNGVLSATTARAHGGTKSLLVGSRTGNAPAVTNLTSVVKPGGSYPVSFWVTVGNVASANVNLTQKIVCEGQTAQYSWLANPVTVSDGVWTELKGTLNVPNCPISELLVYAEGPAAGVDLYVDDVKVVDPVLSNILPDGSFESGKGSWSTWGAGTLAVTTARAHSGAQSLAFTGRTGNGPIVRALTNLVAPGQSYQVVFWASIGGAASANVNLTQKIQCQGGDAAYSWLASPVVVNDGQWTKVAGTLTVPNCPIADLLVYAEGPGAGIDLYIDDVVVSL